MPPSPLPRILAVLLIVLAQNLPAQTQDTIGIFENGARSLVRHFLPDRLFFCTGYHLDQRTSVQFGLQKVGVEQMRRLCFSPSGDSIFFDFYQPLQVVDGRIDWRWDAKVARFSHHVEFGPFLGMKVSIILTMLSKSHEHSRSRFSLSWDGVTCTKAMHWEIDFPSIAERTVQQQLHQLVDALDQFIIVRPKLLVGNNRAGWTKSPWADAMAERNSPPLPLEIVAHRAARIKTNRRKVENFQLQGTWYAQVKATPEHGTRGGALIDLYLMFQEDYTGDYRFEIKKVWGVQMRMEEVQSQVEMEVLDWMALHGVSTPHWQLYPTDPPYDYIITLEAENPQEDRQMKIYALAENVMVVRIVNEPDAAVFVKATRMDE
jgi:hypothetical protein